MLILLKNGKNICMNANKLSFKIIPFAFALNCFSMLGAAENTYYYWSDATGYNKMPDVVDPASWSTSNSEYVAPPEGANVNSPDANWVIDYKAHLPISMRREGYYYNITTPTLNLGSISIVNFNYNNIGSYYDSNNNLVSDGNASAKTMLISDANNAYWNIGNFTFSGGTSSATVVFGSSKFNSTQPEVTLGSVDIGSDGAKSIIYFGGDASGVCLATMGDSAGKNVTMNEDACMKYLTVNGDFNITGNSTVGLNVWNEDTSALHSENTPDIVIDGVVRMTPSSAGELPRLNILNRVNVISWSSSKPAPGATHIYAKIGGLDGRGVFTNNSRTLESSTVKLIFTNEVDCEFSGEFSEKPADDVTTVMSVKMAGVDGKKQIIHADAQFSGTVEVESGTLIMKSSTALGKLTMTGGAFGGIDGGVTVSGADWYGGDIILYGADALNSGIVDKITVDGKLSKLGDGPIGVDFNGYEVSSDYIDNEEMFYELLTATEREGFSDDANGDFYAKNLENCFAKFEWVGDTLTVSFASVPEPAEIGALIGLLTLAIAARRKR